MAFLIARACEEKERSSGGYERVAAKFNNVHVLRGGKALHIGVCMSDAWGQEDTRSMHGMTPGAKGTGVLMEGSRGMHGRGRGTL